MLEKKKRKKKISFPRLHLIIVIVSRPKSRISVCCTLILTGLDVTYLDLTIHEPN